jgi:hypothetical protein
MKSSTREVDLEHIVTPPPPSYVIVGSETGDISRDDVSCDRFFHKRSDKMRRGDPDSFLNQEQIYTYTHEKFTKSTKPEKLFTI